jgi:hypothetical protein
VKKIYTFLIILFLSSVGMMKAQETVLFADDFESGTLDNWTTIDADGDGETWENALYYNGGHTAYSEAHYYDPDNYLITPLLQGTVTRVSFNATSANYGTDYFEVLVSFTGTDPSDFNLVSGIEVEDGWEPFNIELPENTKHVAFRHLSSSYGETLRIDDVIVFGVGSNIISEIYVNDYTEPYWGAHPDYEVTVPAGAHYSVDEVLWYCDNEYMIPNAVFNDAEATYYMSIYLAPESGYAFTSDATVYFNGDASINDAGYNSLVGDLFHAFTIDYHVVYNAVNEFGAASLAAFPNPANDKLFLEGLDGELVSVYDNMGRLVLQERCFGQLNVSALSQGVYALTAAGRTVKFVKE